MNSEIVFVSGIFNILHPGHLRLLKYAREHGKRLVVGVISDDIAGIEAHVPESLRLEAVRLNALVDEAILITTSVNELIARLRPGVVVKGREHVQRFNPELAVLDEYQGRLLFSSGEVTFTSQDLIQREREPTESLNLRLPSSFIMRHNIAKPRLVSLLERLSTLKLVVVGDTIIDEYIACEPLGLSGEDPTVVVTPISTNRFVGGAGVVAAHAASLGVQTELLSVVGDDEAGAYASQELRRLGVRAHLVSDDSRPTTVKQRFRAQDKTLLRVSHLSQRSVDPHIQSELMKSASRAMVDANVLVFSDFNYGVLPRPVVEHITALGRASDAVMSADSQSSSQIGDISRYQSMTLISATERETRLALKDSESGVNTVANALMVATGCQHLLMKLGADGLIALTRQNGPREYEIDQVPALNPSPRDVAGAGDSLLVLASLALAAGADIWEAAVLGSLAAATQVSRIGNSPLSPDDLLKELKD